MAEFDNRGNRFNKGGFGDKKFGEPDEPKTSGIKDTFGIYPRFQLQWDRDDNDIFDDTFDDTFN